MAMQTLDNNTLLDDLVANMLDHHKFIVKNPLSLDNEDEWLYHLRAYCAARAYVTTVFQPE